jgi:site-specific DNA-cytosine methylase
MSPSCQPYTVLNPDAKGAEDKRAQSFIHIVTTVLPELSALQKAPAYLLVENVAGFEVCAPALHPNLLMPTRADSTKDRDLVHEPF